MNNAYNALLIKQPEAGSLKLLLESSAAARGNALRLHIEAENY